MRGVLFRRANNLNAHHFRLVLDLAKHREERHGHEVLVIAPADPNVLLPARVVADHDRADVAGDTMIDERPRGLVEEIFHFVVPFAMQPHDTLGQVLLITDFTQRLVMGESLVIKLIDALHHTALDKQWSISNVI